MSTVDDVPADFPEAKEDQLTWLRSLANVIVDFAWMPPEQEQIDLVAACAGSPGESFEEDIFLYCICKDDKQESMVQCSSSSCSAGSISLVQAFPKLQRETGSVASSVRRTVAIFIAGARKDKREKWFSASLLTPVPSMSGTTWHASCHLTDLMHRTSGTAAKAAKWWTQVGRERILSLTKALMWEGLNHLARKDAVREGDGPAMLESWKMDLIQFWSRSHPKYFIIAHNMLTSKINYTL
ncbi:uncharacterized protein LOC117260601 isoform X1 [Epinephelus lanceolatus]